MMLLVMYKKIPPVIMAHNPYNHSCIPSVEIIIDIYIYIYIPQTGKGQINCNPLSPSTRIQSTSPFPSPNCCCPQLRSSCMQYTASSNSLVALVLRPILSTSIPSINCNACPLSCRGRTKPAMNRGKTAKRSS